MRKWEYIYPLCLFIVSYIRKLTVYMQDRLYFSNFPTMEKSFFSIMFPPSLETQGQIVGRGNVQTGEKKLGEEKPSASGCLSLQTKFMSSDRI